MIRSGVGVIVFAWIVISPGGPALGAHEALVTKHAATHGLPETLIHRVIRIESRGNARAVSKGNYGLMQIRLGTARAMGYRGTPEGLLDPDVNMTYAVKYLAGAYRAAGCNADRAVRYYQRGYHRVRRANCGPRELPAVQVAGRNAETIGSAQSGPKSDAEQAPAQSQVLKPKVVQTIAIAKDGSPQRRVQAVARAEPSWVARTQSVKRVPDAVPLTSTSEPEVAKPTVAMLEAEPDVPLPVNVKPAPMPMQAGTEPLPPAKQAVAKLEPEPAAASPVNAKPEARIEPPSAGKQATAKIEPEPVAAPVSTKLPEPAQTNANAVPLPPIKQAAVKAEAEPAAVTSANATPVRPARRNAKPEAESNPVVAKLEPEPIVRDDSAPAVQPVSKKKAKAERQPKQRRAHSRKRGAAGPTNLLSFLKKLVTPDGRRRQARR
jgi:hypothetical protein